MVEFLLTLPDRQNDYMTGDPKAFMTEWGPRLAPSDLEQAAGYVSKAGLGAARPDATLPSPVIARIKQEGGPGGYGLWGTKGPKDDGENASYLTIYNDLLATQAQLKREGKKLDDAAVKDRLAFWGAKGKVPGSGWFVDDRVARAQFEGNPEYAGKVFDEEIPEATRASIREVLRAGGRPVTEEWVTWTWRDAHGVPAEQNPQPSPVSPEVARDAERANQPLPESYGR